MRGWKSSSAFLRPPRQTYERSAMESFYHQLSRYVSPLLFTFGTVGALLNLVLFHFRKPLRVNSCALYFRALSCNDLLVLWIIVFPQWLRDRFDVDPSAQYIWCCKVHTFLTYTLYTLSPYFVVLACFDRLCTSSTNVKLRRVASIQVASRLIPGTVLVLFVIQIYLLIWANIISTPFGSFCAMSSILLNRILTFSVVLVFCFIPPLLMLTFCTITLLLLRQQRHRVMPVNRSHSRRRDQQLLKMLFIYVTWNILCIVPFTVTYFLNVYVEGSLSPLSDGLVEIFTVLVNLAYASSFYIYTLGTPFYRHESLTLAKRVIDRAQHMIHRLRPDLIHMNDI